MQVICRPVYLAHLHIFSFRRPTARRTAAISSCTTAEPSETSTRGAQTCTDCNGKGRLIRGKHSGMREGHMQTVAI